MITLPAQGQSTRSGRIKTETNFPQKPNEKLKYLKRANHSKEWDAKLWGLRRHALWQPSRQYFDFPKTRGERNNGKEIQEILRFGYGC